jgi:glycosyltransferase involved in cell wall biosynthesis
MGALSRSVNSVCHVTTLHPPFDIRVFHKECKSLAVSGYEVTLIVPHTHDETVDGVNIKALKARTGRGRRIRTAASALRAALRQRADIYHLHDPELAWVGVTLKLLRKKVIFDAHEDFAKQILSKDWIPAPVRPLVSLTARGVERTLATLMDAIVAATPVIAKKFPKNKTICVQNFPLLSELAEVPEDYAARPNEILYVGALTEIRGFREMLAATDLAARQVEDSKLVLVGTFAPASKEVEIGAAQKAGTPVEWKGWQDRAGVLDALSRARVGVVIVHPVPNYVESQPTKIYEYMGAGIPVVASDFPRWRELVMGTGSGVVVDPCDPTAVAAAIVDLLKDEARSIEMGRRGRQAVLDTYNWESQLAALVRLYGRLLPGSPPSESGA